MVPAGQLHRELAVAAAGGGPGRGGRAPGSGDPHVRLRRAGGPGRSREMAPAAELAGTGGLPAYDGAAHEPQGVSQGPYLPVRRVVAAGRGTAAPYPGPIRALDRRGVPGHGAPAGGYLRLLPAAAPRPRRSSLSPTGVRGEMHPHRHPDGGRPSPSPHRLRGLGEPADGAVVGPARGAGGGDRPAARAAADGGGAGDRGGGPRHGGSGAGTAARARVRGALAPAAGGFSGAAPRGGAP